MIFCEAVAIYGVIMGIIIYTKVKSGEVNDQYMYSGYALFSSGITVGLSNLACGYASSALTACF